MLMDLEMQFIVKMLFLTGDTLSAAAKIQNASSKDTKPKFKLQQRIVYRAGGSSTTSETTLFKAIGETVNPDSEDSVSCQVKIPHDVIILQNCEIITVEYYLKVSNTFAVMTCYLRNSTPFVCKDLLNNRQRKFVLPSLI